MTAAKVMNKVLIVDDSATMSANMQAFAKDYNWADKVEFKTAQNGIEAVSETVNWRPDLILMDNKMPVLSGLDATAVLKRHPDYADIPIIMVSGNSDLADQMIGYSLGVTLYIGKNHSFDVLNNIFQSHLRQ